MGNYPPVWNFSENSSGKAKLPLVKDQFEQGASLDGFSCFFVPIGALSLRYADTTPFLPLSNLAFYLLSPVCHAGCTCLIFLHCVIPPIENKTDFAQFTLEHFYLIRS